MLAARRSVQARLFVTLQNREFRFLWGASLFGHLSLSMGLIVLGWIVLDKTGDPWLVAQVIFYYGIFLFLLTIFSGTLSDRFPRKSLMVLGSFTRLGPWVFLAIIALTDSLAVWQMMVASGVVGLGVGVEMPTSRVLIHDLVGNQGIINAMSLDSVSRHVSRGVGPLAGGVLYDVAGAGVALTAICAVQLAALLLLLPIRMPPGLAGRSGQGSFASDMVKGLAYLARNQLVLALVMGAIITNLFLLPMIFLLPVFAREILEISPSKLGLLTVVGTVGSIGGALFMASNPRISRPGLFWLWIAYFLAAVTFVFAWSTSFALSMLLLVLHGLAFATFGALQPSMVILASDEEMRGRTSGYMSLAMGLSQLGVLAMGGLIALLGASLGLATSTGIAIGLLSLLLVLFPVLTRGAIEPEPARAA